MNGFPELRKLRVLLELHCSLKPVYCFAVFASTSGHRETEFCTDIRIKDYDLSGA